MMQDPTPGEVEQWSFNRLAQRLDGIEARLGAIEATLERMVSKPPALAELREVLNLELTGHQVRESIDALRAAIYQLKSATHAENDATRRAVALQLGAADLARERGST